MMCCPKCGHEMEEKELYRIKIDTCRLCEGVFFDRGELEELMMARQAAERRGLFRRLMGFQADRAAPSPAILDDLLNLRPRGT